MSTELHRDAAAETHRRRRRRLLATLGVGLAGAYVAPTLFSVGQAQAWDGHRRSRPSRSRPSWSRPSRSRPSRYDGAYRRHERARYRRRHRDDHYRRDDRYHARRDDRYYSRRDYEHDRRRLRDYREDPVTIVEDIVFGRPERRW
ncbi:MULTISPECIES: hypothetical protein [Halomonas]|uniref:Uncharacterized protein n=1 Tax=Halomonas shengliensis TaxID=419597 RepID=A0A1H0L9X1_9GAMM|nr:hypothetical protein [Halomonas shengliensis]SDO64872.1 hypothetical protein SAMN04487957_10963 [Halomonas shengliensis]